jgi:hypothetical protein
VASKSGRSSTGIDPVHTREQFCRRTTDHVRMLTAGSVRRVAGGSSTTVARRRTANVVVLYCLGFRSVRTSSTRQIYGSRRPVKSSTKAKRPSHLSQGVSGDIYGTSEVRSPCAGSRADLAATISRTVKACPNLRMQIDSNQLDS